MYKHNTCIKMSYKNNEYKIMRKKMCIHKLSIKSLPDRGPRLTSVATSSNKCFHYNLTAIGEPIKEIKFVVEYYKIGQAKVYGFLALPNRVRSTGKYLVQGDQVPGGVLPEGSGQCLWLPGPAQLCTKHRQVFSSRRSSSWWSTT